MPKRSDIVPKGHRVCCGCGEQYTVNQLKQMDGNECCPGEQFSRNKSKVNS